MRTNKKIKFYTIISFILLSILSMLLYFYYFRLHTLFGARDLQFHIRRIMELKNNLLVGNILPNLGINYFHGSAVMGMYPYISLYPVILILLVTHSVIFSYYIYMAIIIFISMIISFFSSLNYSKSIKTSYLFAITYGMSSSFIFEFFANGDLGVALSMAFLPLAIFGFIDIINNKNNYIKFTLGITSIAFCQLPATAIVIMSLFIWMILDLKWLTKSIIFKLLKSMALTALLTSIIWIPIIHIELLNDIRTVNKVTLKGTSLKFFIENLSIIPIIAIILVGFYFQKLSNTSKQMYILSILIILFSSKLAPWHLITSLPILSNLNQFQFTFRFLIIPQILLCYLFAETYMNFCSNYKLNKKYILLPILIIIILLQISTQFLAINKKIKAPNATFNSYRYLKYYETNLHKRNNNIGYKLTPIAIKYLNNGYYDNSDYFPKAAMAQRKNIYNNYATYKLGYKIHHIIIYHTHRNSFVFNNKYKINNLKIPFVIYNNEPLHVYLSHKPTKFDSHNHIIKIRRNINPGLHKLVIKPVINYKLLISKLILFILGISWILINRIYSIKNRK